MVSIATMLAEIARQGVMATPVNTAINQKREQQRCSRCAAQSGLTALDEQGSVVTRPSVKSTTERPPVPRGWQVATLEVASVVEGASPRAVPGSGAQLLRA